MKAFLLIFIPIIYTPAIFAQIEGRWKTIDDNSGNPRSIVEITQNKNKFVGKVVKIFSKPNENPDPVCDRCHEDDARYKQKVIGMEILQDVIKKEDVYINGHLLDPENGKVYQCKLWMDGKALKVRGYWGLFFRTQTWYRDNE